MLEIIHEDGMNSNLEIEETLLHLPFVRNHVSVIRLRRCAEFDVAMSLEVELCEATDVAPSVDMYRKLTEKVDDSWCAGRKREPKHERREDDGCNFLGKDQNLHCEQLSELLVDL